MTAIEVTGLVKRYRGAQRNAVDGVSFTVPYGELFCLLGPNGAGKTTTVSILTTTLTATSGRVRIAGRDLATERGRLRREIGVVFQQPALDGNLTAEENIRLHAVLYGLYPWRPLYRMMPRGYREQVSELAGVLGIDGVLHRRARMLSGGTRRRLEIVRALMHRPRVLFLDEPTAGLDPISANQFDELVRDLQQSLKLTVVMVTHDLDTLRATTDRIAVLVDRKLKVGTIAELRGDDNPWIHEYFSGVRGRAALA
jgi:ABC-2 type transport system ATP-binding protein